MNDGNGRAWGEVKAGLRPSTVVATGALAMALGPVLDRIVAGGMLSWDAWLAGLLLVGIGLVMCTPHAWASPMVTLAGLVFMAQAATLAVALLGVATAARGYQMLAVPKVLALGLLAVTERRQHGRHRQRWLVAAGLLAAVKIVWRVLDPDLPWLDAADLVVNLTVATALWIFARGLRRREDEWARRRLAEVSASFEDFDPDRARRAG
ncbi:MAG: hypothetical protein R3D98_03535 [Candidatus Krumholzibacteriia bacterium]